jgi:ribosomal protein L11 methyltransferase
VVDAGPALEAALDAWKPHARPLHIGPLHIRPAWLPAEDEPPTPGELVVVVDPSRAFGYDHPSTVLCLEAVVDLVGEGSTVLDVGCGSGVLAVAAARLGATVVAVDVDGVAVELTRLAAASNGVVVEVSTREVGEEGRTFDVVLANIGPAVLTALAAPLAARVAPGGALVLAGIFRDQVPAIAGRFVAEGLEAGPIGEREGWVRPVFSRKSPFSAS